MTQNSTNKPTHAVFHVTGEGKNTWWSQIGCGWANKDGEGINFVMNYTPQVPGNLVIRKIKEKPAEGTKQAKKKAA